MYSDEFDVLSIHNSFQDLNKYLKAAQREKRFQEDKLNVVLIGTIDGGKTALIHSLLDINEEIPLSKGRPGRDTFTPHFYEYGQTWEIRGRNKWGGWENLKRAYNQKFFSEIKVQLPSKLLLSKNLVMVDCPSFTNTSDINSEFLKSFLGRKNVFLYIVSSRGITDIDLFALSFLKNEQLIVLSSIRKTELIPTRSLFKKETSISASFSYVIPIVPFEFKEGRVVRNEEESKVLLRCIAFLKHLLLGKEYFWKQIRELEDEKRQLQLEIQNRYSKILNKEISTEDSKGRLFYKFGQLYQLQKDLQEKGLVDLEEKLLEKISFLNSTVLQKEELQRSVEKDWNKLLDRYNLLSLHKHLPEQEILEAQTDLGDKYSEKRNLLLGFIERVYSQREKLAMFDEDANSLLELASNIRKDIVEFALLGKFSSGKSALINALLGIPINDNNPKLLPTSVKTETATINHLEYSPYTCIQEVEWLDEVELLFLSEEQGAGCYRVHELEIRAFGKWIEQKIVSWRDCEFEYLEDKQQIKNKHSKLRQTFSFQKKEKHPKYVFKAMWDDLNFRGKPNSHAYSNEGYASPKLPHKSIKSVRVRQFSRKHEVIKEHENIQEVFSKLKKDPSMALRVKCLKIGTAHPLLRHLSIIDTPGTDAPIPHHRKIAREIIKNKGCPVLYCFSSEQPGGSEDSDNISLLKKYGLNEDGISRFFFVITKKGMMANQTQCDEIEGFVRKELSQIGFKNPNVYFTEVIKEKNADFQQLKRDLQSHVQENRGPIFVSWIKQLRGVLKDLFERTNNRIIFIHQDSATRKKKIQTLQKNEQKAQVIQKNFKGKNTENWKIFLQKKESIEDEIFKEIGRLTSKEDVELIQAQVEDYLDDLNELRLEFKKRLNIVANALKISVGENFQTQKIEIRPVQIDDDFFVTSLVIDAFDSISWPDWWLFRWAETKKSAVSKNKGRILSEWLKCKKQGNKKIKSMWKNEITHLSLQVDRILSGFRKERIKLQDLDLSNDPNELPRLKDRQKFIKKEIKRLVALEREMNRE